MRINNKLAVHRLRRVGFPLLGTMGLAFGLVAASSAATAASLTVGEARLAGEELSASLFLDGTQPGVGTQDVSLSIDGKPVANPQITRAPAPSLRACYLVLVDTSKSMRNAMDAQVKPFLDTLLDKRPRQHLFGLGSFDSEITVLAPFGSDDAALSEGVTKLKSSGTRTELYRASLKGVEALDQCVGYRRVLLLLSDGDAEDVAYTSKDVTEAADKAGIVIHAVGYNDSIHLQHLARLSDETGGKLWVQKDDKASASGPVQELFLLTDNGAVVRAKGVKADTGKGAKPELSAVVELTDGSTLKGTSPLLVEAAPAASGASTSTAASGQNAPATPAQDIKKPAPAQASGTPNNQDDWFVDPAAAAAGTTAVPAATPTPPPAAGNPVPVSPAATPGSGSADQRPDWTQPIQQAFPSQDPYLIIAVVGGLFGLFVIVGSMLFLRKDQAGERLTLMRRPGASPASPPPSASPRTGSDPVAFIEHGGGVIEIYTTPCTIGALQDNDVVIPHDSVSRSHAVMDYKDGKFFITDRGSANGTSVNDKETSHSALTDGDRLRLGAWTATFRIGPGAGR